MIPVQAFFTLFQRIGIPRRFQSAVQFFLNDIGIFQQPHNLGPDDRIQLILTNRRIFTHGAFEMAICVRTDAAVIIQRPCRGPRRAAIQPVRTSRG